MGQVTDRVAERLVDVVAVEAGERVLDVATGTGAAAAAAAVRGASVLGVDISEEMLALARERVPPARFLAADAEQLSLEEERFDAVVAGFILNHLPDPERALASWARALRPGGRLSLSIWDRPERNRFFGLISDAIGALEGDAVPPGPDPYRYAGAAELEGLLGGAGLTEVRVDTLRFSQPVSTVDELWEGLLGGSVRSAARVAAASEDERRRVRARLEELAAPCRADGGLAVPVSVVVGSAVRR
jgi:SAM-dependent methyltransferase